MIQVAMKVKHFFSVFTETSLLNNIIYIYIYKKMLTNEPVCHFSVLSIAFREQWL